MIYYACKLAMQGLANIVYVDPQPHGGGRDFATACRFLGIPIVEENADTDLFLPRDFGTATGDPMEDEKIVEREMQALFNYRQQGNAFSHFQTEQHARPAIRVKMYSGLPWHQLVGMFDRDLNEGIIKRLNDQESIYWLLQRTSSRSPGFREVQPTIRLLSVLMQDYSIIQRDVGESKIEEILNSDHSISVYGGNKITDKALYFLCNKTVSEVEIAAQEGNSAVIDNVIVQMKYDKVGRWDVIGKNVVNYTFFEEIEEKDDSPRVLFHITKKRVKCKHIVMDAKLQKLPGIGVELNDKAKWFISHIMAEPELAPFFGLITGTLVETEEEIIRRWREETELKKALDVIRKKSGQAVAKRKKEIETENELVRKFMKISDPAICFGNDIVFYGWK